EEFSSRNTPIVTIDHELPPRYKADYVGSDEAKGGELIAEHLVSLGHKRIGILAAADSASWAVARRKAFEQAIKSHPGVTCKTIEAPAGLDAVSSEDHARKLLSG